MLVRGDAGNVPGCFGSGCLAFACCKHSSISDLVSFFMCLVLKEGVCLTLECYSRVSHFSINLVFVYRFSQNLCTVFSRSGYH